MDAVREQIREDAWENLLESFFADLRFALRMLRKNPGFSAVAVLTLALGIGANTAIFSLVNGVLLRPLPYRDPSRLVMVWEKNPNGTPDNVGYATYLDWKAQNKSFEQIALYSSWQPILQVGESEQINGLRVTSNYFRALGVHPELGRDFLPQEDNPASLKVVILSHSLWQRKFNSDPAIVGKSIAMNATSYLVAGVLPASYQSLMNQDPRSGTVEIWRVLGYDVSQPWACRSCHHLIAIGRLRAGISLAEATAEMDTISAALWKAYPKEYSTGDVILRPVRDQLLGEASKPLYVLLGAVFFVLLVACANLANLLLARATHREREMAVRSVLGAGRSRIVFQVLVENCLLALVGASVGLLLAYATPRVLSALGGGDLPRLDEVRLDWRVLAFAVGLALGSGLISGLAPALRASNADLNEALKEGARSSSTRERNRLRGLLVVGEVALSLTLLVGAGLLLRSLDLLLSVSPGFNPSHVLTLRISLIGPRYKDNASVRQYFTQAVERLRALPGVQAAAASNQIPLGGNIDDYGFHGEGKMNPNPELDESAERYCATPGFLTALSIPILRGRDILPTDIESAPGIILINQTAARRIWSGEDAIGKRVKVGGVNGPWLTIVGIVGDVHHVGLDYAPNMQMYIPHAQWPFPDSDMTIVLRTTGPPDVVVPAARQVLQSLDATQPLSHVMPLDDYVSLSMQRRRVASVLLSAFAAIGLLLSMVGIFGVTAYSVAQRTREFGIRMALGAERIQMLGLLLRGCMLLVAVGIAAGLIASAMLTRFLASLLFGVKAVDLPAFSVVALLLAAIAAVACWIPARRAMRVDPIVALRYE